MLKLLTNQWKVIKPSVSCNTIHQVSFLPCESGAGTVLILKTSLIRCQCFMDLVGGGGGLSPPEMAFSLSGS